MVVETCTYSDVLVQENALVVVEIYTYKPVLVVVETCIYNDALVRENV